MFYVFHFTIENIYIHNSVGSIMPLNGYKNTTVHFPASILRGLRMYIANHNLTSHDQSKIVAVALKKFLVDDGIKLDPDETLIAFEIKLADENAKI